MAHASKEYLPVIILELTPDEALLVRGVCGTVMGDNTTHAKYARSVCRAMDAVGIYPNHTLVKGNLVAQPIGSKKDESDD